MIKHNLSASVLTSPASILLLYNNLFRATSCSQESGSFVIESSLG